MLATGDEATCGLTTSGAVECWGGTDDYTHPLYISGYEPPGTFTNVAVGRDLACGVWDDGGVVCWGGPFGIESDFPTLENPWYADE
jgi:hypothetical protein